MTPKPNPERFDMTLEEQIAFWMIIIPEYAHRSVREKSLMLYNNKLLRSEDAG